jgi:hypothetical protein
VGLWAEAFAASQAVRLVQPQRRAALDSSSPARLCDSITGTGDWGLGTGRPFTVHQFTIHQFTIHHSPIHQFTNSPVTGFRYAGFERPHVNCAPSTRYSTRACHRPPFTNSPFTIHQFTNSPVTGFRYAGFERPHVNCAPSTRYSTRACHRPPFTNSPFTNSPFTNSPFTIHSPIHRSPGFDTLALSALMSIVRPQPATQPARATAHRSPIHHSPIHHSPIHHSPIHRSPGFDTLALSALMSIVRPQPATQPARATAHRSPIHHSPFTIHQFTIHQFTNSPVTGFRYAGFERPHVNCAPSTRYSTRACHRSPFTNLPIYQSTNLPLHRSHQHRRRLIVVGQDALGVANRRDEVGNHRHQQPQQAAQHHHQPHARARP